MSILERAVLAALAAVALVACTWNLGARALWQDEAACALLGERIFEHGRPLGFADGDLITMDTLTPEELSTLRGRTRSAQSSVDYHVERGDFRADTSWIGQPWGSMLVAGASLKVFGHSTLAARLPFALAGVATVLLLWHIARRVAGRPSAWLAASLLLGNVFWLLHVRQCRYYALATLLALATFAAYLRWRRVPGRAQALLFAATAWCWFQTDFGSFVPALLVLGVDALRDRARRGAALATFTGLGIAVLPFALYYRLHDRLKPTTLPFDERLGGLTWLVDRYQLPLVALAVAATLFLLRARSRPAPERHAIGLALLWLPVSVLWMAAVSPAPFYRYVVDLTPFAALVLAWTVCTLSAGLQARPRAIARVAVGIVLVLTPWASLPTSALLQASYGPFDPGSNAVRAELAALQLDLLEPERDDPNAAVVAFLSERLEPGDEVLVNYEDVPLQFYLDAPVRGGIPCFRAEDPSQAPRFAVLRRSVGFVPRGPYAREIERYQWKPHTLGVPDVPFGHNPDPAFHRWRMTDEQRPALVVLERR